MLWLGYGSCGLSPDGRGQPSVDFRLARPDIPGDPLCKMGITAYNTAKRSEQERVPTQRGELRGQMVELSEIYNARIVELAAHIGGAGRVADADGRATAHSKLCGSTV